MTQMPVATGYEEIVEKRKLELKAVVSELISLCRSQVSLSQFLQGFLVAAVKMVEGIGGCIWISRGERIEVAFETGESREMLPVVEGFAGEGEVLEQVCRVMKPFVAPLVQAGRGEDDQRGNIGLYIPIETEGGLFGILKVVTRRESKIIYKEEVELLVNSGGLVSIYLQQLHMPKVLGRMEEIGKLFEVHREIFSSLDSVQIAFTLANLLPGVIQCERCVVGLYDGGEKLRIRAITGQDLIEPKSVMVRSLTRILDEAGKGDNPLNLTHEGLEGMEEGMLREAGEEYFQEHPFKVLHVFPVKDTDRRFGVISIETARQDAFSQTDLTFMKFVSSQAALAFKNARLFQGIPLAKTWQWLIKVLQKAGILSWAKKILILTAILAVVLVPLLVPVENRVSGQCEVLPIHRYYARAKTEGILKSFLVQEGSKVKTGETVALLDDEPLQKKLREVLTKRDILQANVEKYFGLGQMADYEIERLRLKEVEVEIEFLQSELKKTRILTEGSGVVITPQPRFRERIGKAVNKGEELMEIGELERLRLEVAVDEKDIQFVRVGQKVLFLLNSLPEKSFEVKVREIREKAEVREMGNFFIVEADLGALEGPFKPGMKGEAKVYAGKAPLGEVYLRDMINWFRMKVFF